MEDAGDLAPRFRAQALCAAAPAAARNQRKGADRATTPTGSRRNRKAHDQACLAAAGHLFADPCRPRADRADERIVRMGHAASGHPTESAAISAELGPVRE